MPFIHGLRVTAAALVQMRDDLEAMRVEVLLTNRFSQDIVVYLSTLLLLLLSLYYLYCI